MNVLAQSSEWKESPASPRQRSAAAAPAQHYFAFLSYSHVDAAKAKWLHDRIEGFRIPKHLVGKLTEQGAVPRRLTPIFRDRGELPASDDLDAEIREALAHSRFLIVICSPAAAHSRWTNAEIDTFKRQRPGGCVLAAIVSGEPFASDVPGHEDRECFPPALRIHYNRRGKATNKRAEPLAADLRQSGDGERLGLLKIVAGMLGVGLDELVQRDSIRRQRRLAGITAASLAGMLVTSGLAVTAINARDYARDQRRQAEGLVAFMLGDLKDKLEPIGKLDALDGVGSKVLAYYSKQDTSELTDAALLQRSNALSLSAQVAYLRGKLDVAEQLYRQAVQGTAEAVRRDPADTQRIYDHAQNVFWIGELARRRGQPDRAEAAYRTYKALADRLVLLEPDNLKWRMEALYGTENIGIVLTNQRRFEEAARQFAQAMGPMQTLASVEPRNAEYQHELGNMLAWAADSQRDLGHTSAAIRLRERQIAFLESLVADDPANVEFRRQLIPAREALGLLLASTGQDQRAIDQLNRAIGDADRLIPIEPGNTYWKGLAAQARLDLANILLSQERASEAARQADAGCVLASTADWRVQETVCWSIRSRLALRSGAADEAQRLAQRALRSARAEQGEDPLRPRYSLAAAYRLLGDVRRQAGDEEGAKTAWGAGVQQLPKGVAERPAELVERRELLQRVGRTGEAQQIAQRLAAMGYRSLA